jgi:hypothetical protein
MSESTYIYVVTISAQEHSYTSPIVNVFYDSEHAIKYIHNFAEDLLYKEHGIHLDPKIYDVTKEHNEFYTISLMDIIFAVHKTKICTSSE